jgi:hypothetical protein
MKKEYQKNYYIKNRTKILRNRKIFYSLNKQQKLLKQKKYRLDNKKEISRRNKIYYQKNKKQILQKTKLYRKNNKCKIRENLKNKLKINLNFRLANCLRSRLYQALKYNWKYGHTLELLGCSVNFLKQYLQKQFKPGMSWINYGSWHIDHIRPCASFDLSKESEQKKCFHYTNLQPLWAKENCSLKDKEKSKNE